MDQRQNAPDAGEAQKVMRSLSPRRKSTELLGVEGLVAEQRWATLSPSMPAASSGRFFRASPAGFMSAGWTSIGCGS